MSNNELKNLYDIMCESIAMEIIEEGYYAPTIANEIIYSIKYREFLSDAEKTVRDYFLEAGYEMDPAILLGDLQYHINNLND